MRRPGRISTLLSDAVTRRRWLAISLRCTQHLLAATALVAGMFYFAKVVGKHYPVGQWLFWRYAGYWLATIGFTFGCVGAGRRILELLGPVSEEPLEQAYTSFCLGVLVFFCGLFLCGLLGVLNTPFFFAFPAVLLAVGAGPLRRLYRQCVVRVQAARACPRPWSLLDKLLGLGAGLLAVVGLLLVYVTIISPENALFDARWYHLGIAEQYAAEHAVRRFPEGWYMGTYPHLASFLYTWGMLLPFGALFDQVALCAHLEYATFVWTVIGVGALTRRLVPSARPWCAGAAMFLFPGLYLYDSSLGLGADHVAAMFAPWVFIGFVRTYRGWSVRSWILVAAALSAVMLTKYTAVTLVLFPLFFLAVRSGVQLVRTAFSRPWLSRPARAQPPRPARAQPPRPARAQPWQWLKAPLAAGATGLLLTAPHWLKNWVWYGNPVYPFAGEAFASRPWTTETAQRLAFMADRAWAP